MNKKILLASLLAGITVTSCSIGGSTSTSTSNSSGKTSVQPTGSTETTYSDDYFHFTESWRSVKTQGLVLNAALKSDAKKLDRALALCDFFYSKEGQQLNSYGPESMGYTQGTINYQGREVAKFTTKALEQLNDSKIGKGSYTGYLRTYVGATLPVGYVKEQGMEYQCTNAKAIAGLDVINKGIELGTYKHVSPTSSVTVPLTSKATAVATTEKVDLTIALNYDGTANRITYQQDAAYTTPSGKSISKGDYKPVWQEVQTKFNTTITEVEKAVEKKAVDYFKANWQTDQYADIAAANVSDINTFSVKGTSETILDLTQYMDKLPNFCKFLQDNPAIYQSIISAKYGKASQAAIYYFPYFDGFDDLEKMTLIRADYVRKLLDGDVATLDEDATILTKSEYKPTVADAAGNAIAYQVTVPEALDKSTTKVIKKSPVKNIIAQQDELIASGKATSKALVEQFKKYMDDRFGTGTYAKYSDLFLGVDSCYDADEMIALMRIAKASPKALTGDEKATVYAFVPREYNNQRIADLYRWAGQLWGVRGVESRSGYLYFTKDGKIADCRGDQAIVDMLENLNEIYKEGLIVENFENKNAAGVSDGKFAQALIPGTGTAKAATETTAASHYAGLMEYDYSQTQGVWNDKDASKAVEGYDFRPIMGGVANWDDGAANSAFYNIVPSSFFLSSTQSDVVSTLSGSTTLGSINSNGSTSAFCAWDNYVLSGFGAKDAEGKEITKSKADYLTLVNTEWNLTKLVKQYQTAYDFLND